MSRSSRNHSRSLALLAILVFATGCGRSSFVGSRYDDFTAYYNTFYNAENAFREGVKAIEAAEERIDRRVYLSIFPTPGRATGQQFLNSVNKSADVLRDHPNSKWVDDALLLIGKSYFYQQNFVGAEQKFREVINVGTPLQDEARLWLARTLIAAGAYDEARENLIASLNRDDLSERWGPLLHLALGELYVKQGSFESAVLELESGIEDVRDNQIEARGWYLLGQVYETLGQYEEAATAYEKVADTHPRYELSYAAQYSAVRVRGLQLDSGAALGDLRRMERDDKNYSYRFELAYLRARIYQAEASIADAHDLYERILYDSDGQLGDVRGRIHYALAELYRDEYRDFMMAAAHFDTARTALSAPVAASTGSRAQVQYSPEAITDAESQSQMFDSFADVRTELAQMDSLLHLGTLNDDEFAARIIEIRHQMAREIAEQQRRAEQMAAERGFQTAAMQSGGRPTPAGNVPSGESGFLFHRDPVRVQEARMNFLSMWGERPRVPNWRRMAAVTGSASMADAAGEGARSTMTRDVDPNVGESPLPPLDYANVPRDSLSRAAMLAERALARYELANVLFLGMNRPDSAASWYRVVIEEDAGEEVAQRAFYALAEVHRSLGDSSSANRLYEKVLKDYPKSDFAGRVREQLGIREDVPSDTLALAVEEYENASARWNRGRYADALNRMMKVAADFRQTEVAPKALLAAARIYLEWASSDSLDIFAPLPLTLADSLVEATGLLDVLAATRPRPEPAAADSPPANEQVPQAQSPTNQLPAADSADRPSDVGAESFDDGEPVDSTPAAVDELPFPQNNSSDGSPADTSLALPVDTLTDTPASGATAVDTLADTTASGAYATEASANTTALDARADTTSIGAPVNAPAPVEDDNHIRLETLYEGVKQLYPRTPYATQAGTLLIALQDRQKEIRAAADSLARANQLAADSLMAEDFGDLSVLVGYDSLAAAGIDSPADAAGDPVLVVAAGADSLGSTANAFMAADSLSETALRRAIISEPDAGPDGARYQAATDGIPEGDESGRGEGGIRRELGGFTLILDMNVRRKPMEALAEKYAKLGFRTDVIVERDGDKEVYRAALGHFPTQRDAGMFLSRYASEIEESMQIERLAPLD